MSSSTTFLSKKWSPLALGGGSYLLAFACAMLTSQVARDYQFDQVWVHPVLVLLASIPFFIGHTSGKSLRLSEGERFTLVVQIILFVLSLSGNYYIFSILDQDPLTILGFALLPFYLSVLAVALLVIASVTLWVRGKISSKS